MTDEVPSCGAGDSVVPAPGAGGCPYDIIDVEVKRMGDETKDDKEHDKRDPQDGFNLDTEMKKRDPSSGFKLDREVGEEYERRG